MFQIFTRPQNFVPEKNLLTFNWTWMTQKPLEYYSNISKKDENTQ